MEVVLSLAPVAAVSTHNVEHVCTVCSVAGQWFVEMYFMIVLRITPRFHCSLLHRLHLASTTVSPAAVVTSASKSSI